MADEDIAIRQGLVIPLRRRVDRAGCVKIPLIERDVLGCQIDVEALARRWDCTVLYGRVMVVMHMQGDAGSIAVWLLWECSDVVLIAKVGPVTEREVSSVPALQTPLDVAVWTDCNRTTQEARAENIAAIIGRDLKQRVERSAYVSPIAFTH